MHTVQKPFHSAEHGRILQVGEKFESDDAARVKDLENGGLIGKKAPKPETPHVPPVEPATEVNPGAPSNKDAAGQRKAK